jgi:hypothetical protein
MTVLDRRTLNRTLLIRHGLIERVGSTPVAMIEHLAGLQSQNPHDPYVALWSRIASFDPMTLSSLLEKRKVVRATLMRATIHLVTARDLLAFRPLVQTRLERGFWGQTWRGLLSSMDPDAVAAAGLELMSERPMTTGELRDALAARFPGTDADAMAAFVKSVVPSVQATPRGLWGRSAHPAWSSIDAWVGKRLGGPEPGRFFLRYLETFGPATVADFRTWSGLTGYNDVVESLRGQLRSFRDENGRELLDTASGTIADAALDAPVRFFPDYDNVFIGHQDRSRIVDGRPWKDGRIGASSFSVDGFLAGHWRIEKTKTKATLRIDPWRPLGKHERAQVAAEGERLLAFIAADRSHDLGFV